MIPMETMEAVLTSEVCALTMHHVTISLMYNHIYRSV